MSTHSSILAWEIPQTEEPGGLQSIGSQKESDMTYRLNNKVLYNIVFSLLFLNYIAHSELILHTNFGAINPI